MGEDLLSRAQKDLKKQFGFSTATVTVYVVIYKMQREGLIRIGEEKSVLGRPNRKYYEITDKGKMIIQRAITFLEDLIRKLSLTHE